MGVSSKTLFSFDFSDFLRKLRVLDSGCIVLKLEVDFESLLVVFCFVAGASGVKVTGGIGLVSPSCYLTVICNGIFKAATSL